MTETPGGHMPVDVPVEIPLEYVLKEVERENCEDARLGELNVHLVARAGRVFVHGDVASAAGRRAVLDLVHDRCPQCAVVDELTVEEDGLSIPPNHSEEIR